MATSYLEKTVKAILREKKVEPGGSIERVIWEADRKLDRGEIDATKAMEMLRSALDSKLERFDYSKIEKEVRYRLSK